jgi:hypothetical protein
MKHIAFGLRAGRLEETWFDSWQGQEIFLFSKASLGLTQPPIQFETGVSFIISLQLGVHPVAADLTLRQRRKLEYT